MTAGKLHWINQWIYTDPTFFILGGHSSGSASVWLGAMHANLLQMVNGIYVVWSVAEGWEMGWSLMERTMEII